jgi:hypothetical protein
MSLPFFLVGKAPLGMIVRTLNSFRPHESFKALTKEADPQGAYRVLETQARQFAGRFGFAIEEGESVWDSFPPPFTDELTLYEAVRGLQTLFPGPERTSTRLRAPHRLLRRRFPVCPVASVEDRRGGVPVSAEEGWRGIGWPPPRAL